MLGQDTGHNKTIGNWGCLLVVYNMLASYYGLTTQSPGDYNLRMVAASCFSNQYILPKALETTHPSDIEYVEFLTRDDPRMIPQINNWLVYDRPMPARVDFNPATDAWEQHWVLLIEAGFDDYKIIDPWTGKVGWLSDMYGIDGDDVLEAIFYQLV